MTDSIQNSKKSGAQWRTITAVGAATWLVTTQLSGCDSNRSIEEEAEGGPTLDQPLLNSELGGEGEGEGEGGEGHGGEGEGEGTATDGAEFATDDIASLTQLGLIRGHLAVGHALYSNDLPGLAETHMKHPREEIYATVEGAFKPRGCDGFGDNLSALTAAVVGRESKANVDAVYAELTNAIATCEQGADTSDPKVAVTVIENLLRTAGIEYEIGVVDGKMNNLHEYQDAWGFTRIADDLAKSEAFAGDPKATAVAAQLQDLIAGLQPMWPSLNPEGTIASESAQLFGAAAQVQVIAFNLDR